MRKSAMPAKLCPFHRDLTVTGTGEKTGKTDGRPVTGDDSQRKFGRTEEGWQFIRACS